MLLQEDFRPEITILPPEVLHQAPIKAGVLRLDKIDARISGNKWYKLKEYIKDARRLNKNVLATFGGAFSNHIAAVAAACSRLGFVSAGIIRGERPKELSPTLKKAAEQGMDLFFMPREAYKSRKIPESLYEKYNDDDVYVVNEGGYGEKGMLGAKSILEYAQPERYTHILAAVGTGTMLAGLTEATGPHQQVIGISALKNNPELQEQVNHLVSVPHKNRFRLIYDYHFGGYAKYNVELTGFMNRWYRQTGIPSDFVYTGKLLYAFQHLCAQSFFSPGSTILIIHSGGLQGNCSLTKGTLLF